jgi:hypothetical protein
MICTAAYVRAVAPSIIDRNKQGCVVTRFCATSRSSRAFSRFLGVFFMSARIGALARVPIRRLPLTSRRREAISLCLTGMCSHGRHSARSMRMHFRTTTFITLQQPASLFTPNHVMCTLGGYPLCALRPSHIVRGSCIFRRGVSERESRIVMCIVFVHRSQCPRELYIL